MEGWDHPVSREALILMDQYDLDRKVAGDKRWKGYQRPWPTDSAKVQRGNADGRTPAEMKRILREQFGQPAAPV